MKKNRTGLRNRNRELLKGTKLLKGKLSTLSEKVVIKKTVSDYAKKENASDVDFLERFSLIRDFAILCP